MNEEDIKFFVMRLIDEYCVIKTKFLNLENLISIMVEDIKKFEKKCKEEEDCYFFHDEDCSNNWEKMFIFKNQEDYDMILQNCSLGSISYRSHDFLNFFYEDVSDKIEKFVRQI